MADPRDPSDFLPSFTTQAPCPTCCLPQSPFPLPPSLPSSQNGVIQPYKQSITTFLACGSARMCGPTCFLPRQHDESSNKLLPAGGGMLIIEGCCSAFLSYPRTSVWCPPSPFVDLNNDINDFSASNCAWSRPRLGGLHRGPTSCHNFSMYS